VRPAATEVITIGEVVELFEHGEIGEEL
jgi:hypothetical protein